MNAIDKIYDRFFDATAHPLTALVYDEDFVIGDSSERSQRSRRRRGFASAAFWKYRRRRQAPSHRCDMSLQDLASGETIKIYEERGALARGCRLDLDGLARVCALVLAGLSRCDLVLVNKFGKTETEGGGFRCVISDALALEIPVVVGVPRRNLAAWRDYAGEFAVEHDFCGA